MLGFEGISPILSRILLIQFDALTNVQYPVWAASEFATCEKLLSCLVGDFSVILHKNKIDKNAQMDCVRFLEAAIGGVSGRGCSSWGSLLYYVIILHGIGTADEDAGDLVDALDWIVRSATISHFEISQSQTLVDTFVMAVQKVWDTRGIYANSRPEDTLHFHNWRTFSTGLRPTHYAFKLDSVVDVIKRVTKVDISVNELKKVMKKSSVCLERDDYFYDVMRNVWPICSSVQDMETGQSRLVPLSESELDIHTLKKEKAYLVQISEFVRLKEGLDAVTLNTDSYKKIEIESAEDGSTYNFYRQVCYIDCVWYGYRAINNTPFAHYCGYKDFIHIKEGHPWTLSDISRLYDYSSTTVDEYRSHSFPYELSDQYGAGGSPSDSYAPSEGSNPSWDTGESSQKGAKRARF